MFRFESIIIDSSSLIYQLNTPSTSTAILNLGVIKHAWDKT